MESEIRINKLNKPISCEFESNQIIIQNYEFFVKNL